MKKSIVAASIALAMGVSASADAGIFANGATYTVVVHNTSCFAFGDCTVDPGSIANGSFTITTDATGDGFSVGGYSMDPYLGTAGGVFTTGGPVAGSGSVDMNGNIDLDFAGRTGSAQFFPTLGPAWNIEDATGNYQGFTSGADTNFDPTTGLDNVTLTGSALTLTSTSNGIGWWTGRIVSVGNVGAQWQFFAGTPYTEVYDIWVHGPANVVPVPAAAWLMGSGLLGLVGVARRRKAA